MRISLADLNPNRSGLLHMEMMIADPLKTINQVILRVCRDQNRMRVENTAAAYQLLKVKRQELEKAAAKRRRP